MKKICIAIAVIYVVLMLSGCSSNEINVEKIQSLNSNTKSENIVSGSAESGENIPSDTYPKYFSMGEKFIAETLVSDISNGEVINMSVDDAKLYDNLTDAGIMEDELFDDFDEGVEYDGESGKLLGNLGILMVTYTLENVNAVSPEYIYDPDNYGMYDFRIDVMGTCGGPIRYSNHHREGELSHHYFAFNLEPGKSITMRCGYLVNLDDVNPDDIAFTTAWPHENGIIVKLNLG